MNLLDKIPDHAPEEIFTDLLKTDGVRIERIVSFGQSSPEGFWYDPTEYEWVMVQEGRAVLEFEGQDPFILNPGDYVNIPAGQRHRVVETDPDQRTVWLAVFYSQ